MLQEVENKFWPTMFSLEPRPGSTFIEETLMSLVTRAAREATKDDKNFEN